MAVSVPFHFTTVGGAPAAFPVRAGQSGKLKGFAASNAAGVTSIKLYWWPPSGAVEGPVVGTTVPNMTITLVASVNDHESWPDGITGNGQLWAAVTGAPADNDTTAATAGAVITLLVE